MKQKSFLQNFTWVGIMLLIMGIIWMIIGVSVQFAVTDPDDLTVYQSGVMQATTTQDIFIFRMVFLLMFGLMGLAFTVAGVIIIIKMMIRRKRLMQLKAEGAHIVAEIADYVESNIRVNYRRVGRRQCSYTGADGITYIFKTPYLRMDPAPYLDGGKVHVYYERDNMKKYVVDVDGSIGLGNKVVEL